MIEEAGFTTVLQAWDFAPGDNFVAKMQDASARAKRTLAVLSPDYLQSRFSTEEWTAALADDKLIPVRVREVELGGILAVQVYIDLVGLTQTEAAARLVEELGRKGRLKPSRTPRFPGSEPRFPGALPAIWNVPPIRNPNFTGRDAELVSLETTLKQHRVVALTGLGGVGKSQLAVQLAHRWASQLDLVWWITADEPATLVRDLGALAKPLGIEHTDEVAEAVRRRLEQTTSWLVVFDNASDPATVREWLPQGEQGSTLITSRHGAWGRDARSVRVEPLRVDAASELLKRRSGQQEDPGTAALAERLGGLPLALEQAAAYLEATGMRLSDYLALFDERASDLLGRTGDSGAPTVATVWNLSFQQLRGSDPAAANLLTLAAFLAADDIPRDLLTGAERLPKELTALSDPLVYADAVAAAARYSLLVPAGDAISVHRLVQSVTRDRLSDPERRRWSQVAIEVLEDAFPYEQRNPTTWAPASRLLPHVLAASEHAIRDATADQAVSDLLNSAGLCLAEHADFMRAQAIFERAIAISTELFGPDDPNVATPLSNLASVLSDRGDLDGAQKELERALKIDEAAFGSDNVRVAVRLNNLGDVLRERGHLNGALTAFERALAINERHLEPGDPTIAVNVNNIGLVRFARDDFSEAKAAFERALAIDEVAYGDDHPEIATDLTNLAGPLRKLGRNDEARAALERAVHIFERAYGPEHPKVGSALHNLAVVLANADDFGAARSALDRALAITETTFGPGHWWSGSLWASIGGLLDRQGDREGARAAIQRGLDILELTLGPDNPRTQDVRSYLDELVARP